MSNYRIGFDVGGTKIQIIVLDGERVMFTREMTTSEDVARNYELINFMYQNAVEDINYCSHTVGVGIPGNVARPTYVFAGTDPQAEFDRIFERHTAIENDANCFALAETRMGAALGFNNVFGVILGTGVGGGIVLNGEIYRGTSGLVAEWGHNVLVRGGRECWCGLRGCYEAYISGRAVQRAYNNASGESKSATEILTERDVRQVFIQHDFYKNLSVGLANMINVLDPEVVVIGGGLSGVSEMYSILPELVEKQLFSKRLTARIVQSGLTHDAGAIGAALIGK